MLDVDTKNSQKVLSMQQTSLVSVIIPTWNSATVLPETLRSLQAQTYRHFEAIIVDDGSTDDTVAVARRFCEADPRLRLVFQNHCGLSATRNAGLEQAHGEYIAFLDSDDVWLPEKLARQMALFREDRRVNFAYSNFYFWDGARDLSAYYRDGKPMPDGNANRRLIFANIYGLPTVVVRRELLRENGGFDTGFDGCEDWDLWLRLAGHGMWARGIRDPLVRYRRWAGNMSNHKLRMAQGDVSVLEKNLRATQCPELRPLYRRSLAFARAKLELARARQLLDASPDAVSAAVWRAWRLYPRRLKWLMWFALVSWPEPLGGRATARIVHRKLIQKF